MLSSYIISAGRDWIASTECAWHLLYAHAPTRIGGYWLCNMGIGVLDMRVVPYLAFRRYTAKLLHLAPAEHQVRPYSHLRHTFIASSHTLAAPMARNDLPDVDR